MKLVLPKVNSNQLIIDAYIMFCSLDKETRGNSEGAPRAGHAEGGTQEKGKIGLFCHEDNNNKINK